MKAYSSAWRTFGLSNGLCSWFGRNAYWPERRRIDDLDVRVLLQQPQQVVRRLLDEVDLARQQRIDGLLLVGDREPFDAVDLDDLAAGETGGRLGARLVFVELDVDRLVAGLPLVPLEHERAEPVKSAICLFGSVSATRLGIMNGTFEDGLARPSSTRPVGSFSFMVKVLASTGVIVSTKDIIFWPSRILARPALDRGDAVLRRHRLAVMPEQAVAQRERVGLAVGRDLVLARPSAA